MNREDMIDLIKVEEAINRLNDKITSLTNGYGLSGEEYEDIYQLYEVLRRNSRYPGTDDHDEDMFRAIVNAINKTPEEKYELLKRDDDYDI